MERDDYRDSGIADVSYVRNILEWLRGNAKGFDRELFLHMHCKDIMTLCGVG